LIFWWAKLGLYGKKNQEGSQFRRNKDLTDRQSKHLLFGSGSTLGVLDDVDDDNVIDFIFGRGCLSLDDEGELKVPKLEPLELDEHDHRRIYRARVLEGDLPLVLAAPVLWGPIVVSEGSEGGEVLQVVVDDVAEFVEDVAGELVDSVFEDAFMEMARHVACDVCFEEDAPDV
jgi:hypothetical protein